MIKTSDIQMRDPFIVPEPDEGFYYLFGTTDKNYTAGFAGVGFDCFRSKDLRQWEGPIPAFRPSPTFWGKENFWAPEVHKFNGRYYMFASFKADEKARGTQVLVSSHVTGPYIPLINAAVTPARMECLDGTLYVDSENNPWIIFCHEWVQINDGGMCAMRLSADLKEPAGEPILLFNASDAPWVKHMVGKDEVLDCPRYVTDGPFMYRTKNGTLLMLWSGYCDEGYATGIARSESGTIVGPWHQDSKPLWSKNGGHSMIFTSFDDRLFMTLHTPNEFPNERPFFVEVEDSGNTLLLKK